MDVTGVALAEVDRADVHVDPLDRDPLISLRRRLVGAVRFTRVRVPVLVVVDNPEVPAGLAPVRGVGLCSRDSLELYARPAARGRVGRNRLTLAIVDRVECPVAVLIYQSVVLVTGLLRRLSRGAFRSSTVLVLLVHKCLITH